MNNFRRRSLGKKPVVLVDTRYNVSFTNASSENFGTAIRVNSVTNYPWYISGMNSNGGSYMSGGITCYKYKNSSEISGFSLNADCKVQRVDGYSDGHTEYTTTYTGSATFYYKIPKNQEFTVYSPASTSSGGITAIGSCDIIFQCTSSSLSLSNVDYPEICLKGSFTSNKDPQYHVVLENISGSYRNTNGSLSFTRDYTSGLKYKICNSNTERYIFIPDVTNRTLTMSIKA